MKVEFKQSVSIDGKEFKIKVRNKPATHEVAGYFIFISYFVALIKDGLVKIIDADAAEFSAKNIPEAFHKSEPDPLIITIIEGILAAKEPAEENDEDDSDEDENEEGEKNDEEHSDSSNIGDSSDVVVTESDKEPEGNSGDLSEQKEEVKTEEAPKLSQDEIEFAALEEKKLRLTNKEKKRHQELKLKLKG